jgi:excisionase family DNA binding protein
MAGGFMFDEPTARALLDALRIYEGRLMGSGQRLPSGVLEIRAVAERSVRALTVQPSEEVVDRADTGGVTQLLTIRDVAFALQASDSTVKRLVASGELTSVHVGRSLRVRPGDLQEYINSLAAASDIKETAS